LYPYAPIKGAKVIYDMVREGMHKTTRIVYVKYNDDKNILPTGTLADFKQLEGDVRALIGKSKNYIKLDTKEIVNGKKSGKLITNKLWRAVSDVKDFSIFSRKEDNSIGDTAMYVLCDASGSMHPMTNEARSAIYMIARLAINYNIPCKIVAFDTTPKDFTDRGAVRLVELKDWEERTADKVAMYEPVGGNRDGVCVHIATLELAQRPETNKILFVLSDGCPYDDFIVGGYYDKCQGVPDTASYIRKARTMGIKVIGIFIDKRFDIYKDGEHLYSRVHDHKIMYGNDLFTIGNLKMIPPVIIRTLAKTMR
jgi:hypothetical protein